MLRMEEYHIGNTPMMEILEINGNHIFIKAECENFLGSIKSRSGYQMIHDLPEESSGKIIIESTSGNLGIALGFFCKEVGKKFLALIDPTIAKVKLERLKNSGIAYRVIEAEKGCDYRSSRIKTASQMVETGEFYWVNQYNNISNIKVHENTTAPEIWEQTSGNVTHIICAMGSCGTICGLGNFFHKYAPKVKIIGVEPYGSTIFGIINSNYINVGAGLYGKPGNLLRNPSVVDEAYTVTDIDAITAAKELAHHYQINAGVTTGMAFTQAMKIAQYLHDANIVVISPDGRESYHEYL